MPSKSTKTLATRVPLDLYYKLVDDASAKGVTLSDYVCGLIYKIDESRRNGANEEALAEYKQRTRKAFTEAVKFAVREYKVDGEKMVEIFNANMG
jgi:predicted RecB family nuclease